MQAKECILQRRSIRRYRSQKLLDEVIEQIVEGARFAPSWANTKAIRYICIQNDELKNAIGACCVEHNQQVVEQSPALFAVVGRRGLSGLNRGQPLPYASHTPEEWLMVDGGIAVQTLCLSAWDLGIGTLIMGGYPLDKVAGLLELPEDEVLIALVAAGYPDEKPTFPRRRELKDILQMR